jgi:membrane fusion protein (multidrug efflux system)
MRTDPLRLVLTLPEQHVALAREGAPVEFTVGALPGRIFKGRTAHIGAMVEAASRSLTVEALVDNADGALRPGYFATARLFYPTGQQALAVPASAVLRQGDVARVFVVRDGIAREQIVTVGDEVDGKALVTGGIADSDQVVADASRVSDGARVR